MDTIKIQKQKTQMIAHRGLSGIEMENTNAAFVAAGNRSYYGIETDIWRTSDGFFVINHDGNTKRYTGEDRAIESYSSEELKKCLVMDRDGTRTRGDLRFSFLPEYVELCKKYNKECVLELKSAFTAEEIDRILAIFREADYLAHVIFISFDFENLVKIRKLLPEQPIQFLTDDGSDEMIRKLAEYHMDIDIGHWVLTEEKVAAMHEAGLRVNCWTVDNPEDGEKYASWGVDFLTSNILE